MTNPVDYSKEATDVLTAGVSPDAIAEARVALGAWSEDQAQQFLIRYDRIKGDKAVRKDAQDRYRAVDEIRERRQTLEGLSKSLKQRHEPIGRSAGAGVAQAVLDAGSLAARPFSGETADRLAHESNLFDEAARQSNEGGAIPEWILTGVRGASRSVATAAAFAPLGEFGIIGMFGIIRGNQAITEANDAGLTGKDKRAYVGRAALIEGGIAGAFSAVGWGGFEKILGGKGTVSKAGIKGILKAVGISAAQELPEEVLTEMVDNYNQAFSGVEPDAITPENQMRTIRDTVIQTLMAVGMTGIVKTSLVQDALKKRDQVVSGLAQSYGLPEQTTRSAYDEAEALHKKGWDFDIAFGRSLEKAQLTTKTGALAWAFRNPQMADALADIVQPSRKDFADNKLPAMAAEDRARLSQLLREAREVPLPPKQQQEETAPPAEEDLPPPPEPVTEGPEWLQAAQALQEARPDLYETVDDMTGMTLVEMQDAMPEDDLGDVEVPDDAEAEAAAEEQAVKTEDLGEVSDADFDDIINEVEEEMKDEEEADITPGEPAPEAEETAQGETEAQRGPRVLIESAAKHGVKGVGEAAQALHELFGGSQRMGAGMPSFDQETYEKIKPHLHAAYAEFVAAGRDLKDFVRWAMSSGAGAREYLKAFKAEISKPTEKEGEVSDKELPVAALADKLIEKIAAGEKLTWQALFKAADLAYGGTRAENRYRSTDAYEALEFAVNRLVGSEVDVDVATAQKAVTEIQGILQQVPTQTMRSGEKDLMQQFSTPADYAYAAVWVAGVTDQDVLLEPSGGTGSLATHASTTGATVIGNELSKRRAALLSWFADRVFTEDAEQLSNVLPDDIKPTVVVMNPPFSQAGKRMGGKMQPLTGAKHIEQALKVLQPGGRLVSIVGRGMAPGRPRFAAWWSKIGKTYKVRANVGVSGDVYAKYGTRFGTRLLVIDKTTPGGEMVTGEVETISELIETLKEVRDARSMDVTDQPEGAEGGEGAGGDVTDGGVATDSADDVGDGERDDGGSEEGGDGSDEGHAEHTGRGGRGKGGGVATGGGKSGVQSGEQSGGNDSGTDGHTASEDVGDDGGVPSDVPGVDVETAEESRANEEEEGGAFETYSPSTLVKGAQEHPSPLVESAAMASVKSPPVKYRPKISAALIKAGVFSDAQLEAIALGGEAHQKSILLSTEEQEEFQELRPGRPVPEAKTKGIFVGDGTGSGKGRVAAGFILDNLNQGRKKAVWISEKSSLLKDAKRDWSATGKDEGDVFLINKTKVGDDIKESKGILFATYDTLGQSAAGRKEGKKTRIEQVADWFGEDYDGVIVMDESHNMGNATTSRGKRGRKPPSNKALMGIELQRRLPKAKIVYMSATGATEVSNLAYVDRLGLWGEGTPFRNREDFIDQISTGGLAAMEVTARDMKAMGLYLARTLSFKGVGYSRLTHALSVDQQGIFNTLASGWQTVLQNIEEALELTAGFENVSGEVQVDRGARAKAMSAFWGRHQLFFNQVLTSLQMPSVIKAVEKDIADGKAVVVQLVNTLEASTERALASMTDEDSLESLDITPRDELMQMIEKSFPVTQMEEYQDADGNTRIRAAADSNGEPILNREAVAKRDALLEQMASIATPEAPLDQLINHFGFKNVSEVTGRKRRVVKGESGKREIQKRGSRANAADIAAFMDGDRDILIFSQAGGTGASYHADPTRKNQKPRVHYVLQPGWRADKAIQGLGRSHRSNQVHTPEYKLVETDLPGHKRFISTIARRLEQLGALSRGQRDTGGGGMFSESDNLEGSHAHDALSKLMHDIVDGSNDIDIDEFERQTGLKMRTDDGAASNGIEEMQTNKFLNRLLSLNIDMQNKVFDAYSKILAREIEIAIATDTLDTGMEEIDAVRIEKVSETVVRKDANTSAETRHVELAVYEHASKVSWDRVRVISGALFVRNKRSGVSYVLQDVGDRTDADGRIVRMWARWSPAAGKKMITRDEASFRYEKAEKEEVGKEWDERLEAAPDLEKRPMHLITGALLPVWTKLSGSPRIRRAVTVDGERYLGRVVPNSKIQETLKTLGVNREIKTPSADEAQQLLSGGGQIGLENGWTIISGRVSGDLRIEVVGLTSPSEFDLLRNMGAMIEKQGYRMRAFIPVGAEFDAAYQRLIAHTRVDSVVAAEDDEAMYANPSGALSSRDALSKGKIHPTKRASDQTQKVDVINAIKRLWPRLTVRGPATIVRRKALGWYNPALGLARLKDVRDITTALHELGHYFDHQRQWWSKKHGLPPGIPRELAQLGRDLYGDTRPAGGYRAEGFAEFIREYLTGSDEIQARAPRLYAWFTTEYLADNPDEAKKLREVELLVSRFNHQTPQETVQAFVAPPKKDYSVQRISTVLQAFDAKIHSSAMPVLQAMQRTGADLSQLRPSDNPFMLITMHARSAGGRTLHSVLGDSVDLYGQKTGIGLRKALEPIAELGDKVVDDWVSYAVAKRATYLHARGIQSGISPAKADAVVKELGSEMFDAVLDEVTAWSRRILHLLVESGAMTETEFEKIELMNPVYVPFSRRFSEKELRKGRAGKGRGVYRIKGSGREIHNPLDAMVLQAEHIIKVAQQADVLRALVKFHDSQKGEGGTADALGGMIAEVSAPKEATTFSIEKIKKEIAEKAIQLGADPEEVAAAMMETWQEQLTVFTPAKEYKGKDNVVAVTVNGKRRFFELDSTLMPIIQGMAKDSVLGGPLGGLSRRAVALQRLGATGLNPAFGLLRNPLRDTLTAFAFADYHFHIPVISTIHGSILDIAGTDQAQMYHALGLDIAGMIGQDMAAAKRAAKRATATTKLGKLRTMGVLSGLREVLSHSEVGPRLMEFRGAYKHGLKTWGTDADAAVLASCAAKDITVNFSQSGSAGRAINETVLFFNASVQSVMKLSRALGVAKPLPWGKIQTKRGNLARTARRTLGGMTFVSLMNYFRNRDKDWWKDLPAHEKWGYIHVGGPSMDKPIFRVPLPFEVGSLFGAIPCAYLEDKRNPGALDEALKVFFDGAFPLEITSIRGFLRNVALLSPAVDTVANKDWKDADIVPQYAKYSLKKDQAKVTTTWLAKLIGAHVPGGYSPAKIDHLINGYTGNLYRRMLDTIKLAVDRSDIDLTKPSSLPLFGTLFLRPETSRSIGDFYDRLDLISRKKKSGDASVEELGEWILMDRVSRNLSGVWSERRDVISSGKNAGAKKAGALVMIKEAQALIATTKKLTKADHRKAGIGKLAYDATSPNAEPDKKKLAQDLLGSVGGEEIKAALKVFRKGKTTAIMGPSKKLTAYGKRLRELKKLRLSE